MKINNNISAVISNKHLLRSENALSMSMERLSSGFKINHAVDDPSGIAISNKMNAQIDGLSRSSRNASDGISVLDTADGAMGEITSMIQRMRELSVQAANDLNTQDDKKAIQLEIDSLTEEINRISSPTEFNTKSLLNGSLDNRVYGENLERMQVSDKVEEGIYKFSVTSPAEQAQVNLQGPIPTEITETGNVKVNGYNIELSKGMDRAEAFEALRKGAEIAECELINVATGKIATAEEAVAGATLGFRSTAYGNDAIVNVEHDRKAMADMFPVATGADNPAHGKNATINLDKSADSLFSTHQQATVKQEGNKITISDRGGFEMSMMLEAGKTYTTAEATLEVTDVGPMDLQIGANEGQQMTVKIPSMDIERLYIDDIDVTTVTGADRAIARLDEALTRINSVRASIGAYTNRLEHTVESLDATEENMSAAISRLKDVDMAKEMTEFTKDNVLQQAGTSALSQANEIPQMALQLMG